VAIVKLRLLNNLTYPLTYYIGLHLRKTSVPIIYLPTLQNLIGAMLKNRKQLLETKKGCIRHEQRPRLIDVNINRSIVI